MLDRGLAAAQNGKLEDIRRFVAEGWDPQTYDHLGSTALHWAAGSGHLEVVKYFLEELCVDPRQSARSGRKDGKTAIHWAARNGRDDVVKYLLSLGLEVDLPTKDGSPPLAFACFGGHLNTARLLVESKADVQHRNKWQCSLAHWGAMGGHVPICEWLLSLGLSFEDVQKEGQLPLHKAAVKGHADVVRWLRTCTSPSTLLSKDSSGLTALELAQMTHHNDVCAALAEKDA